MNGFFLLDVELKAHSILFEDIQRGDANQQIRFIVLSFVIMGMKGLDCVHGVDRCSSSKKKRIENKIKEVIIFVVL